MSLWIGRTNRTLSIRVYEHIYNILLGFKDHSVSLHFRRKHNRDPSGLLFWGIDTLISSWRDSNMVREISKSETRWIYLVDTFQAKGLNMELDLNCFIIIMVTLAYYPALSCNVFRCLWLQLELLKDFPF